MKQQLAASVWIYCCSTRPSAAATATNTITTATLLSLLYCLNYSFVQSSAASASASAELDHCCPLWLSIIAAISANSLVAIVTLANNNQ